VSAEQRALSNQFVARSSSLTAKSFFRHAATIVAITPCHWDQKVRVRNYPH